MKRKSLIIAAPEDLNGVEADANNIESFLHSNLGGNWDSDYDEMKTMYYPTSTEVQRYLTRTSADYTFVYYSGHGYYDPKIRTRRLCINERENMPVSMMKANTSKQLLIADSCGTIVEDFEKGEIITEWRYDIGGTSEINSRKYFDDLVRLSSRGFIRIYSAAIGQGAGEDNLGGYFTRSLLDVAKGIDDFYNGKKVTVLSTLYAFQLAKKHIRAYDPIQTPTIYGTDEMRYCFPFALRVNY